MSDISYIDVKTRETSPHMHAHSGSRRDPDSAHSTRKDTWYCNCQSARCASIARRVRECADVALFDELGPAMFETLRPMLPEFDAWHASELVESVKHPDGEELAIFIRRSTVIIDGVPRCRRLVAYAQTEEERQVMMVAEQPGDSPPEVYAVISAAVRRHGWLASKTLI